jgi:hypothetical protein
LVVRIDSGFGLDFIVHASVYGKVSFPPGRMRVNRRACRFGRYKKPCRPHPLRCASWASHHLPQVSALTLAHLRSPAFTYPYPPLSFRPTHPNWKTIRTKNCQVSVPSLSEKRSKPIMMFHSGISNYPGAISSAIVHEVPGSPVIHHQPSKSVRLLW